MTAGDMIRPPRRQAFTRERLARGQELYTAGAENWQAVILFLGLTVVWFAVLWMAVFGSRPHIYLLILAGTYTVGVLSGTGLSSVARRRSNSQAIAKRTDTDEPIDAEVRPAS